jgi:hypothetical protein
VLRQRFSRLPGYRLWVHCSRAIPSTPFARTTVLHASPFDEAEYRRWQAAAPFGRLPTRQRGPRDGPHPARQVGDGYQAERSALLGQSLARATPVPHRWGSQGCSRTAAVNAIRALSCPPALDVHKPSGPKLHGMQEARSTGVDATGLVIGSEHGPCWVAGMGWAVRASSERTDHGAASCALRDHRERPGEAP